jgi:hypothetical protein
MVQKAKTDKLDDAIAWWFVITPVVAIIAGALLGWFD